MRRPGAWLGAIALAAAAALPAAAAAEGAAGRYENPVDGRTYVAPRGWETYAIKRQGSPLGQAGRVQVETVRLLAPRARFEAEVGAEPLARAIREVERHALEVFAAASEGEVLVQVDSGRDAARVRIVTRGEVERPLLQAFYDRVSAMPRLQPRSGADLAFQVHVAIGP